MMNIWYILSVCISCSLEFVVAKIELNYYIYYI